MSGIKETYQLKIPRFYVKVGTDLTIPVESYSFGQPNSKARACVIHHRPGNNRLLVERKPDQHSAEFASRAKENLYEDEVTDALSGFSKAFLTIDKYRLKDTVTDRYVYTFETVYVYGHCPGNPEKIYFQYVKSDLVSISVPDIFIWTR